MSTISSRFAASVRPPLSRCRYERTKGVTACPCTPAAAAAASASSIRGSTSSRLSTGGRPSSRPPRRSSQCAARDSGRLARRFDSGRDGRPAVSGIEERQRVGAPAEDRHTERLEQFRGGGHVEQRLHAGRDDERLRRGERLQVGRDIGRRRPATMDTAEAAGRHETDTHGRCRRRGCRRRWSPRPRAVRRLTARSRGPSLRADSSNRSSSSSVRPTRISPSSTPIGRGHRAAVAHGCSEARPTSTPSPGGNPCAISVVSRATTPRSSRERLLDLRRDDHGIAPSCAQQRAAASRPSVAPPIRKPAASASPAPVVSTTSVATAG